MTITKDLHRNHVLVFEGGTLTVKDTDCPVSERWGTMKLDVSLPSWEAEHATFEIPPSELIELRDFLNKIFPPLTSTESPRDDEI